MVDSRDQALTDIRELVEKYGWAIRHVLPSAAAGAFSYTVGLSYRGWPELIVTGLPTTVADAFLRNAIDVQNENGSFEPGDRTDELTESGHVVFIAAADVRGMTATANVVGTFSALQLIWPDSAGAFPWDSGYRNPIDSQPLLGPSPA